MKQQLNWMKQNQSFQSIIPETLTKGKLEALKSLYRSPGYKKILCKNYALQWQSSWNSDQHKKQMVKDLPMINAQFRFNQCNSFREEHISVFSPYGPVLIL